MGGVSVQDRSQQKNAGVRYAQSLQMVFKTAALFSATHQAVTGPLSNSFDQLNALLKESGQYTIGFVDQRVLLNNILTTERSLASLEAEFLKRGIGAVTFDAGITLTVYRKAIGILSGAPRISDDEEDDTRLADYLSENPVQFVRIHAAPREKSRTEDTILEMDSESFLMSKAMSDSRNPALDRIDDFFRSVGISPGASDGNTSAGLGGLGAGGNGTAGGGFGHGTGGSAGGDGGGPDSQQNFAPGGPSGISAMVENYFRSTVNEGEGATQRSYRELAKVIQDTRPEFVLASFSPQRREELRKMPPEQMAAEVIEDSAVKWAAERLVSAPSGDEAVIVEQEVIRVLLRTLQTTQTATRLARKLADFVREFNIPESTHRRIEQELEWVVVPTAEKTAQLQKIKSFNTTEFRRLTQQISDLIKATNFEPAAALAQHYMDTVVEAAEPRAEDLGRLPELITVATPLKSKFWGSASKQLLELAQRPIGEFRHMQVVNGVVALSRVCSRYEEFDLINEIGAVLEQNAADAAAHAKCCANVMKDLLPSHSVDRILEICMQRREDRGFERIGALLLRRCGKLGVARAFQQLEDEPTAAGRMMLLRLIGRIGSPALDVARERLRDEKWYIVRNACKLLGELKDPEILKWLAPALGHSDQRVQQAALSAIIDSREAGRAGTLAEALPKMHGAVLEDAASELMFLRDPVCVEPIRRLLLSAANTLSTGTQLTLVRALITCANAATEPVMDVVKNRNLDAGPRRAALNAILQRNDVGLNQELITYATANPVDVLAAEIMQEVKLRGSNPQVR